MAEGVRLREGYLSPEYVRNKEETHVKTLIQRKTVDVAFG